MKISIIVTVWIILAAATASVVKTSDYENDTKVDIYINKVGPFPYSRRQEAYGYSYPVCYPKKTELKSLTSTETKDGDGMLSLYEVHFKEDVVNVCNMTINAEDFAKLKHAVEELYIIEFVVDDMYLSGFIGVLGEFGILPHTHFVGLWTHVTFDIEYNGSKIIHAKMSANEKSVICLSCLNAVKPPFDISFTYTVRWHPTEMTYADRAKRGETISVFLASFKVPWLKIIMGTIMVMAAVVIFGIILILLVKRECDLLRHSASIGDQKNRRWMWIKVIEGDVFRAPTYPSLFCAVIGVGTQFLVIATGLLIMAAFGVFGVHRHATLDIVVVLLYALASCISGCVASNLYHRMGGRSLSLVANLTSLLFTVPCLVLWVFVNTISWFKDSSTPCWTTVAVKLAVVFVGYLLTFVGAKLGQLVGGTFDAASVSKLPREIPKVRWNCTSYYCYYYFWILAGCMHLSGQRMVATRAVLQAAIVYWFALFTYDGPNPWALSLFTEMIAFTLFHLPAELVLREHFTVYGLLCVYCLLLLTGVRLFAIAATCCQLFVENHRWWWRTVFTAGPATICACLFTPFYFWDTEYCKYSMSSIPQMMEYFAYILFFCLAVCLALGAVNFFSSLYFIRGICAKARTSQLTV